MSNTVKDGRLDIEGAKKLLQDNHVQERANEALNYSKAKFEDLRKLAEDGKWTWKVFGR